jgi:CheY-like chemotaxis protein
MIEGDLKILRPFCHTIPGYQYEVLTVETASGSMELVRKRAFDVVIADIRLTGCSGLELLTQPLRTPIRFAPRPRAFEWRRPATLWCHRNRERNHSAMWRTVIPS